MKKILSLILVALIIVSMLTACSKQNLNEITTAENETNVVETESNSAAEQETEFDIDSYIESLDLSEIDEPEFNSIGSDDMLQYINDCVYAGVEDSNTDDDIQIENIASVYISKEYIEELEFNSQENIFFGYTLSEVDAKFAGQKYVFTPGDDGNTTVRAYEEYDDSFEKTILKNVCIGSGVILVCVTGSVLTAGTGLPVAAIFAVSAKTAAIMAAKGTLIGGLTSGIITGIQTKDMDAAMKAALTGASEGFKWGAIVGSVKGAVSESFKFSKFTKLNNYRASEILAKEKYGGKEQVSYLNGKVVAKGTLDSTRPDIVRTVNGHLEAIEVKNYNLKSRKNVKSLIYTTFKEISARTSNMPAGTTQRVVLDVSGKGYSSSLIKTVINAIKTACNSVCPDLIVEVL